MQNTSRRISPFTLFMLSMNALIGSGWLFAPLYAAKVAGPGAIISWVIGGVAAILIALTFAELSTMLPVSGGSAHIPQLSHGTFASFVLSWVAWITTLMLVPIEVQAVLQYAALYFPSLMHMVDGAPTMTGTGYASAAVLMIMLCFLNVYSYGGLVRFNNILFVFKFFVILLTGFAILHTSFEPSNFSGIMTSATTSYGWQAIFSAVATSGIVLAFNGFKSGVEMAGEAKNLKVAIPLSTVGSVLACLLIYLLLQVSFIGALEPSDIKDGWGTLNFAGDMGPFVGLAAGVGLFWLLKLIYVNAVISPLGAGLIYVTSTARILYAMSRIGYVPKFLSKLNRQRFPFWAVVVNFIFGMFAFLPLPGWQAMVSFLISAMIITYAMGPISLLCLRATLPNKERPFRLPAANFICVTAFYSCNLFGYWTGWETISKLGIVLLTGLVIFSIAVLRGGVTITRNEYRSALWLVPYLGGTILISYLGAFGGRGVIPFGWDFAVIAVFTVAILYLAVKTRLAMSEEAVLEYVQSEAVAMEG